MLEALSVLLVLARAFPPPVDAVAGRAAAGVGGSPSYSVLAPFANPDGPYCARQNKCCTGRVDECAEPILDTLCYCDNFCDRTSNPDCCPDYHSHCVGGHDYERLEQAPRVTVGPPVDLKAGCYFEGVVYRVGETIRHNCNDCQCVLVRQKTEMQCSMEKCLIDPEVVDAVNSYAANGDKLGSRRDRFRSRWTAANYTEFWGRSLKDGVSLRLGTLQPSDAVRNMNPLRHTLEPPNLPPSFDARVRWPGLLSPIEDQGWCGASWAVSTAAVASDRFAIMSLAKETPRLATQHLLDCNNRKQHGCNGGHLDRAWYFTRKFGLVPESCYPWTGRTDKCRVPKRATLETTRCPLRALSSRRLKTELYRMAPAYRLAAEQDIMREIIRSGPVQATMEVYQDLFTYRAGIYEHLPQSERERRGYHSVRIVGWGEEGGVKFWLVANSWGEWWGEKGYFRIRRSVNECRIEDLVLAAWAFTHIHRDLDNTITM